MQGYILVSFLVCLLAFTLYINTKSDIIVFPLVCNDLPSKIHKVHPELYINTTSKIFQWKTEYTDNLGKVMGLQIKGPKNENTNEMKLFVLLCGDHMASGCTKEGKTQEDEKLVKYVDAIIKARDLFVLEFIFDTQIKIRCNFT